MEEKRKCTSFYISDILGDDSQRPVAAAAAAAAAPSEDAAAIPAMSPASTTTANPGTEAPDDGSSGEDSRSCDAAAAGVRRLLPVAQAAAGNRGGGFAMIDERWARLAPELVFLQTFCAHASLASLSCSRVTQQLPTDYSKTASKVHVGNDDSNTQKKCRRSRTVFSETQLLSLEKKFESHKYLSTPQRIDLAEILGLTQLQVKTWYQNRRMKWKQEVLQNGAAQCPTKPKGRPKKLPAAVEHIKRPAPTEPIPTP